MPTASWPAPISGTRWPAISRAADLEARISLQAGKVADLNRQIADLDAARTIEAPAAGILRTAGAINAQAAALAAAARLRAANVLRYFILVVALLLDPTAVLLLLAATPRR